MNYLSLIVVFFCSMSFADTLKCIYDSSKNENIPPVEAQIPKDRFVSMNLPTPYGELTEKIVVTYKDGEITILANNGDSLTNLGSSGGTGFFDLAILQVLKGHSADAVIICTARSTEWPRGPVAIDITNNYRLDILRAYVSTTRTGMNYLPESVSLVMLGELLGHAERVPFERLPTLVPSKSDGFKKLQTQIQELRDISFSTQATDLSTRLKSKLDELLVLMNELEINSF